MKKFRVNISQEVYETITVEVEANDEDEARELAEIKRVEAESGEWDSSVKQVWFDVNEKENVE